MEGWFFCSGPPSSSCLAGRPSPPLTAVVDSLTAATAPKPRPQLQSVTRASSGALSMFSAGLLQPAILQTLRAAQSSLLWAPRALTRDHFPGSSRIYSLWFALWTWMFSRWSLPRSSCVCLLTAFVNKFAPWEFYDWVQLLLLLRCNH